VEKGSGAGGDERGGGVGILTATKPTTGRSGRKGSGAGGDERGGGVGILTATKPTTGRRRRRGRETAVKKGNRREYDEDAGVADSSPSELLLLLPYRP
jgi:hypothetical protein